MFIPVILFFASATFGAPTVLTESQAVVAPAPYTENATLEAYVRDYFKDEPILAEIAFCESTMRHFDKNGEVLRGAVDQDDVGVMQINTRYHQEDAEELGIDLLSLRGNLEYARHLYEKKGTQPWSASMACWGHLAAK